MSSTVLSTPAIRQKEFSAYGSAENDLSPFYSNFLPLPTDKYVAVCCDNDYEYWPEVFELIAGVLAHHKISVIDVSRLVKRPIAHCVKIPSCSMRQAAYLLENSALVIAGDDWATYVSERNNYKGVKIKTKPESLSLSKASGGEDNPFPEKVAQAVLERLDIEFEIQAQTELIGEQYNFELIDIVPDFMIQQGFSMDPNKEYGIRCDICENWIFVRDFCALGYQPTVTCTTLPPEPLLPFLGNIKNLVVLLDLDCDPSDLKRIVESGINYILICKNKDDLEELQARFFDFEPVQEIPDPDKNFLDKLKKLPYDTNLKTNRAVVSKFGTFLSSYHYNHKWSVKDRKGVLLGDAAEDESFIEESELFYYYTIHE